MADRVPELGLTPADVAEMPVEQLPALLASLAGLTVAATTRLVTTMPATAVNGEKARRRGARAVEPDASAPCPSCGRRPDGLMTLETVARHLALSPRTIRREVAAGRFHCVRVGRSLRFAVNDVRRFVAAGREA